MNYFDALGPLSCVTFGFAGMCVYTDGRTFRQGDSWTDGCAYTCTCEDAPQNTYKCDFRWVTVTADDLEKKRKNEFTMCSDLSDDGHFTRRFRFISSKHYTILYWPCCTLCVLCYCFRSLVLLLLAMLLQMAVVHFGLLQMPNVE